MGDAAGGWRSLGSLDFDSAPPFDPNLYDGPGGGGPASGGPYPPQGGSSGGSSRPSVNNATALALVDGAAIAADVASTVEATAGAGAVAVGTGTGAAGTGTGVAVGLGAGAFGAGAVIVISGSAYLNYRATIDYSIDSDYAVCGGDAECMGAITQAKLQRLAMIRARAEADEKWKRDRFHLFRGVTVSDDGYLAATKGMAIPRGGYNDPIEHNQGNTNSIFTSWTTREHVAEEIALSGGAGVILDAWFPRWRLVWSEDMHNEGEVLVVGPVAGANVRFVPDDTGGAVW